MQGDETAHIGCILEFHWLSTIDAGEAYPSKRAHGQWAITPTWNWVFRHLGPELMDEASEEYLMERLSALCLEVSRDDLLEKERSDSKADGTGSPGDNKNSQEGQDSGSDDDDDDQVGQIYEATVTIESFNDVKVQFAALGLIERGTKRRPGSDTRTYWRLTERGNNQLLRLRAIQIGRAHV